MSSKTKAELAGELADARIDHAEFRLRVTQAALRNARKHGWCVEVVRILQRLGLQDCMPTRYVVQARHAGRRRWTTIGDPCFTTLAAARQSEAWEERTDSRSATRIVSVNGYDLVLKVHDVYAPDGE